MWDLFVFDLILNILERFQSFEEAKKSHFSYIAY